jgi:hypothetical protein
LASGQVLILLFLVGGWGYWAWGFLLSRRRMLPFRWVFAGLGGYLAQLIVLDTTTRLGVPVHVSTWPVLAIGAFGIASAVGSLRHWWAATSSRSRKDALTIGCVFAVVLTVQGAGLLYQGPQNYYGKGRADQLAWVTLGQYLAENGFPYDTPELQRHPWTLKVSGMREQRMIQVVATAELAVASLSDAKSAYGVQSVFFATLVPVCVFVVLRSFSVWRPLALTGALWVGVLPSLTKIHLDGFLAQVSVLFLFPLLLAGFRYRLDRDWRGLILIAIYAAYVFSAYTDFYPFAVVLLALLFASPWPRRDSNWILRLVIVVILSLLLSALYLRRGISLFLYHLEVARDKSPILEVLAPAAGTVWGWFETLFRPIPASPALAHRIAILCILGATLVGISAFFSRSLRNRYHLAAAAAVPVGYLCILVSGRNYPKYPFWKVSDSFAWLLVVLILLGLYRLALLIVKGKHARFVSLFAVCGLAVLSFVGYVREMAVVFRSEENLAVLNAPALRAAYRYLDNHPGSTVLIREQNPIVAGWLSYHGRKSAVHVDRILLAEGYLPPGDWMFYAPPADMSATLVGSSEGLVPAGTVSFSPSVEVRNPQGKDRDETDLWYWMGDELEFLIVVPDERSATRRWILEFVAIPGPSNPTPSRRLALTVPETRDIVVEIHGRETVRIPVRLKRGTSIVHLRALWPTEQTVWLANDSRKLMVRISHVALRPAEQ